jgi:hypothetical protein
MGYIEPECDQQFHDSLYEMNNHTDHISKGVVDFFGMYSVQIPDPYTRFQDNPGNPQKVTNR